MDALQVLIVAVDDPIVLARCHGSRSLAVGAGDGGGCRSKDRCEGLTEMSDLGFESRDTAFEVLTFGSSTHLRVHAIHGERAVGRGQLALEVYRGILRCFALRVTAGSALLRFGLLVAGGS